VRRLISEDQSGIPSEGYAEVVVARGPAKEVGRPHKDQNTGLSKCEFGSNDFGDFGSLPVTLELDDGCSIIYFVIVAVASRREFHKAAIELDDL
jgi:hypothetical protein